MDAPRYKADAHRAARLFARLKQVFQSDAQSGTRVLNSLIEETLQLVKQHLPDVDHLCGAAAFRSAMPNVAAPRNAAPQPQQALTSNPEEFVMSFIDILRAPDFVAVHTDDARHALQRSADVWGHCDIEVRTPVATWCFEHRVAARKLPFNGFSCAGSELPDGLRFLGDHWSAATPTWSGAAWCPTRDAVVFSDTCTRQRTPRLRRQTGANSIAFWRADRRHQPVSRCAQRWQRRASGQRVLVAQCVTRRPKRIARFKRRRRLVGACATSR
jgi:hypothetical protein